MSSVPYVFLQVQVTFKEEDRQILELLSTLDGYCEAPAFENVFPGSGTENEKKSLAGEKGISELQRSLREKLWNLHPRAL